MHKRNLGLTCDHNRMDALTICVQKLSIALRYVNMPHKFFQTGTKNITLHPSIHVVELRLQLHQLYIT